MRLSAFFNKIYKKLPVLCFDCAAIPVAWYLAYWLRYNMQPFPIALISKDALHALFVLMVVQISCYYYFKVYRGLWRFSSLNDLARIMKAACSAVVLVMPLLYLTTHLQHLPRSVFPLYVMLLVTLLGGGRLLRRIQWDSRQKIKNLSHLKRVLIVGAGDAGESLIRDLKRTAYYLPVGLVDDNPRKRGLDVHGVPVLGAIRDLGIEAARLNVDLIFIAIPSARSALMRRIVEYCEASGVPFRTLPSLPALADGRVEVNALRAVSIEDLLGRDEVRLDWGKIKETLYEKRVVVTGGGGSIGSELCRQILAQNPAELLIIEHSEYNLYRIEQELQRTYPSVKTTYALLSVTDAQAIKHRLIAFKPDIVFHAAAYKHVPLLENQIRSAVLNNVIGTQIVSEASIAAGVSKFILISSDKAVNPSNIMGASKRIAEIYCQNLNSHVSTQFITVRFGNVLGSTGSVVPLFQKQLRDGGPLTVTHPEIERYFMTIPEACQLILQSTVNGLGSEIFVLDMGEPIKIRYLAEQMIRLSGKEIDIVYTGLRPGEKLYEELFHAHESLIQTEHEKLFKASFRAVNWTHLTETLNLLAKACDTYDEKEIEFLVKLLVPEFHNSDKDVSVETIQV